MDRRSFLGFSAGMGGLLLPRWADALAARPCPPSPVSVSGGDSVSTACRSAADDWARRSSGAGVLWAHDFTTVEQFKRFAHPASLPKLEHFQSGGAGGYGGFVRCKNLAGQTTTNNTWERPLAPLPGDRGYVSGPEFSIDEPTQYAGGYFGHPDYWTLYPGRYSGHEFYVQIRTRVPPSRWQAMQDHDNGKNLWFASTQYTPAEELVVMPTWRGHLSVYTNFGSSIPVSDPQVAANGVQQKWQPGGNWDTSCVWAPPGDYPDQDPSKGKCWVWPGVLGRTEWVTLLMRVKLGHAAASYSDKSDSEIEIWVANEGDREYRLLARRLDAAIKYSSGTRPMGLNSIRCSSYMAGKIVSAGDWHQDYSQIICSREFVPCPQT